jgi:hypothetical protein
MSSKRKSFSEVQLKKTQRQLDEVAHHAVEIGKSFLKSALYLNNFINFMRKQKMTIQVIQLATKVFNQNVRKVFANKQYASNLLYTVWDVLYKRQFKLLRLNCSLNRKMNLKNLLAEAKADTVVFPKSKKQKTVSDAEVTDEDICFVCKQHGFVVECDNCHECAHPDCVGITNSTAKTLPFWHCSRCSLTIAEPDSSVVTAAAEPDSSVVTAAAEPDSSVVTAAAGSDSSVVTAAAGPDSSVVTAAAGPDSSVVTAAAGPDSSVVTTMPAVTAEDSAALTTNSVFPVAVSSTPVYCSNITELSRKIANFRSKIDASLQQSVSGECQGYFHQMETLMELILSSVQSGTLQPRTQGVPAIHPILFYRRDNETAKTNLPAFIAGWIPADLIRTEILTQEWQNCTIQGVGSVKLFHISTQNLGLDALAIQVDSESVAYHVNGCLTSVMGSVVTLTKGNQTVSLLGACSDFLAWASNRQAVNFTEYHMRSFTESSRKVVECGLEGDCFYHSALYLLRLNNPDFRLDCERRKKLVPLSVEDPSVTHMDMRKAVCRHLKDSIQGEELKRIVSHMIFGKEQNENEVVKAYCKTHQRKGVYAESPIVWAFAHFAKPHKVRLIIHHVSTQLPQIIANDEDAQSGMIDIHMWNNEEHYQVQFPPHFILLYSWLI